jgi:hypothetical protein
MAYLREKALHIQILLGFVVYQNGANKRCQKNPTKDGTTPNVGVSDE